MSKARSDRNSRVKQGLIVLCAIVLAVSLFAPTVLAQPAEKVYRIGFLTPGAAAPFARRLNELKRGLRELGYVEGRNTIIEARFAAGRRERLPALAEELVALGIDIFVTHGSATEAADRAARASGRYIPVVFAVAADPVGSGFVASLAKPGGNVTGLSDSHSDLVPKRLELLKEVKPATSRVAVFWSLENKFIRDQLKTLRTVAPRLGIELLPVEFGAHEDADRAFATLRRERPDALNVLGYPLMSSYRRRIAAFGLKHGLPIIGTNASNAIAGYLLSYGVDFGDQYRRAAVYVDKVLKGAKPADLPIEQPTRFYLSVNLKTAKALGITIPPAILLRADEVIE